MSRSNKLEWFSLASVSSLSFYNTLAYWAPGGGLPAALPAGHYGRAGDRTQDLYFHLLSLTLSQLLHFEFFLYLLKIKFFFLGMPSTNEEQIFELDGRAGTRHPIHNTSCSLSPTDGPNKLECYITLRWKGLKGRNTLTSPPLL